MSDCGLRRGGRNSLGTFRARLGSVAPVPGTLTRRPSDRLRTGCSHAARCPTDPILRTLNYGSAELRLDELPGEVAHGI
jgi:hypothetical protein